MITKTRVAAKFLFYGLVVGLLFAPRSGKATRDQIIDRMRELLGELSDLDLTRK